MVEPTLYFALGFLVAALLALIIAPSIWRRAVTLTRRRVEVSLPMTLDEIEAGKDRIRAETAVTVRRLEMAVAAATEKTNVQMIEIGRAREEIKRVEAEHDGTRHTLKEQIARTTGLEARNAAQVEEHGLLSQKISELERVLALRAKEFASLGEQYQEAAYTSGIRQIELTARENDIQTLRSELSKAAQVRVELEQRHAEQEHALGNARETASAERKRADDRDDKLARSFAFIADHEEALTRAERDTATMRALLESTTKSAEESGLQLAAAQDQIRLLEGRIAADGRQRAIRPLDYADAASDEATKYAADRRRLEDRLTVIAKQNQKLRAELAALQAPLNAAATGVDQDAVLREQISAIAAQVVHLAHVLEGPASQIDKALALPSNATAGTAETKIVSLADRIRALRKP